MVFHGTFVTDVTVFSVMLLKNEVIVWLRAQSRTFLDDSIGSSRSGKYIGCMSAWLCCMV
jgi:hypothetical protein